MQIRLTKPNEKRLKKLVRLFRQINPDYNHSPTMQANDTLCLGLTTAIKFAEVEAKENDLRMR